MKTRIAIIPARGGSKRIPRKNIKLFHGKPIIAYPIETLVKSGLFDRIIVSTDDQEIAEIAQQSGAEVPFLRSQENASDTAATYPVIKEVLDKLKTDGVIFDTICCVYPTSVFVTPEMIRIATEKLETEKLNSIAAITKFGHPIQRAISVNGNLAHFRNPEFSQTRTQDLETFYHDTGQFYLLDRTIFENYQSFFTDQTGFFEFPENLVQDIDNETDWKLAELKYQLLHP